MAVATARHDRYGRFSTSPRSGVVIMVAGLVVAVLAAVLVFVVAQRSRATVPVAPAVPQVDVVVLTQDAGEGISIPAAALAVKPFPQGYAPPGALTALDQVAGKYPTTRLSSGQIVLASQLSPTAPVTKLTESIPVGKVALWMSIPTLLAQAGVLHAGDRVDILLSMAVPGVADHGLDADAVSAVPAAPAVSAVGARTDLTTQTTLQNVEVLMVGAPRVTPGLASQATQGIKATQTALDVIGSAGQSLQTALAEPQQMVLFVLDPQDAVVAKYIKDSGGMIDFVMRSPASNEVASTVAVDARSIGDRFHFSPR